LLSKKGKSYLHILFKKWNLEHIELDEAFNDYIENDELENIVEDEGM